MNYTALSAQDGKTAPASSGQARLWFLSQLEPGRSDYNVAIGWRIAGDLDVAALRGALQHVVDRHEILRTTFDSRRRPAAAADRAAPRRRIRGYRPLGASPSPSARRSSTRCLAGEIRRAVRPRCRPVEPRTPLPARRARPRARDRPSSRGVRRRFGQDHRTRNRRRVRRAPRGQGAEFAAGRGPVFRFRRVAARAPDARAPRDVDRVLAAKAFRRACGAGASRRLGAPGAPGAPTAPGRRSASTRRWSARSSALAGSANATLHMTLLAAFQVLLGRHADQDDVLVGSPVSAQGRPPEFKDVMGFLVNTVVHRGDLRGDPTFRELLARTAASAREAYAHRELSIERVVEAAAPEREPGRDPLFQAMFTLQEHDSPPLALAGLECRAIRIRNTTAKADLSLLLYRRRRGLVRRARIQDGSLRRGDGRAHGRPLPDVARARSHAIPTARSRACRSSPTPSAARSSSTGIARRRTFPAIDRSPSLFDAQVARAPHALAVIDGVAEPHLRGARSPREAPRAAAAASVASRAAQSSACASSARRRRSSRSSACSSRAARMCRSTRRIRRSACRRC